MDETCKCLLGAALSGPHTLPLTAVAFLVVTVVAPLIAGLRRKEPRK